VVAGAAAQTERKMMRVLHYGDEARGKAWSLFRLSDVSDSEKKTNQFIPDVELFFNGIKIADGQIYIADVTPDEISIVFLLVCSQL
jgi:hypothetical protein